MLIIILIVNHKDEHTTAYMGKSIKLFFLKKTATINQIIIQPNEF